MSYDYSDRFSNWQSGGAAVADVEVVAAQPAISDNFRMFVINAEFNDQEFTVGLFHALTEYDWFVIWSAVNEPEDWTIVGEDIQIEYLLCDFHEDLLAAIAAEDEYRAVPLVAFLDNAIREADDAKAFAQEALITLDVAAQRLTQIADEAIAKYPLL